MATRSGKLLKNYKEGRGMRKHKAVFLLIFPILMILGISYQKNKIKFINTKFSVQLTQCKNELSLIEDKADIDFCYSFPINHINFLHSDSLEHSTLGKLGFSKNFFLTIEGKKEGAIYF